MRTALIVAAALLPLTGANAAETEHREHGAHEHGHGKFNVAIEGKTLAMELMAPGADIVGFEHKAESEADKQALAAGRKTLSDLAKVVTLPAAAGCTLNNASVEVETEEKHDDHGHGKKKDDHEHAEKHDDHDHGKKKDDHDHAEKKDDHGHAEKKDDHDHDHDHGKKAEHKDEETHGEFHAEYQLTCSAPEKLTGMTFVYFDTFKGAEELDVTVIGPKQQLKFEVNRETSKIAIGGIM